MTQIQAYQINRLFVGKVSLSSISVSGSSVVLTSQLTTACNTAGNGGVSVPYQVSTNNSTLGILSSGTLAKCEIFNAATNANIEDTNGNQIYGVLSFGSNAYTLTFYSAPSGTPTPYSFGTTTNINILVNYNFDFYRLPYDSFVTIQQYNFDQVGLGIAAYNTHRDNLAITTLNTVPNLSVTPLGAVDFFLNGVCYSTIDTNPAFSVSGQAIAFSPTNATFALQTGVNLIAKYESYS